MSGRAGGTLRLHWSPDSANLPVRIALEMFGLPYEGVPVDRSRREQDGAAYRALNPQGLIPVLQDGNLVLFETGAILWHVAERAGRFGPEGPVIGDPLARAAVLRWLFYLSNTLHADLRVAFQAQRYVAAGERGALLAGLARRVSGHLELLEGQLRPDTGLAGGIGILEAYLACCVRWAQRYPRDGGPMLAGLEERPTLALLLARLEGMPAVRRAVKAEAIPATAPFTRPEPPALPPERVHG